MKQMQTLASWNLQFCGKRQALGTYTDTYLYNYIQKECSERKQRRRVRATREGLSEELPQREGQCRPKDCGM